MKTKAFSICNTVIDLEAKQGNAVLRIVGDYS